jgi:hypothetical protein
MTPLGTFWSHFFYETGGTSPYWLYMYGLNKKGLLYSQKEKEEEKKETKGN